MSRLMVRERSIIAYMGISRSPSPLSNKTPATQTGGERFEKLDQPAISQHSHILDASSRRNKLGNKLSLLVEKVMSSTTESHSVVTDKIMRLRMVRDFLFMSLSRRRGLTFELTRPLWHVAKGPE